MDGSTAPDPNRETRLRRPKFFMESKGIDKEVLNAYMKRYVDEHAGIEETVRNQKRGFLIEASRVITAQEREEIMAKSKNRRLAREETSRHQ